MCKAVLIVAFVVAGMVFAQEIDIYEEDTPLPVPYLDSTGATVAPQSEESPPPVTTKVIIKESYGKSSGPDISMIRANARRGLGTYIAGFVMEYGIAVPLAIAGATNLEEGPNIGAAVVELVSTGFLMVGPIRAGVAASEAYDYSRVRGFDRNKKFQLGVLPGWVGS